MALDISDSFVAFRFVPEAGTAGGRLTVEAAANSYSGRACAWIDIAAVKRFADELGAYPLPATTPISLTSGFADPKEEHVGLRVSQINPRGQIRVAVHLATASANSPPTRPESIHEVRLELLTTYERVGRFGRDLSAVLRGGAARRRASTLRLACL
jgi:hypothetical protein